MEKRIYGMNLRQFLNFNGRRFVSKVYKNNNCPTFLTKLILTLKLFFHYVANFLYKQKKIR